MPKRERLATGWKSSLDPLLVVSVGCPAGIGPEVSLRAVARQHRYPCVLVSDEQTLFQAAELCRVSRRRLLRFDGGRPRPGAIHYVPTKTALSLTDRRPGKPSRRAGAAQLEAIEQAYELVRKIRRAVLVTGPVSKAAIVRSGAPFAKRFVGHTEWLRDLDGADHTVMCFASSRFCTSLVTTHLPLARVPSALSIKGVVQSTSWLARLCRALGVRRPRLVVCSLNPHAGENEVFGREETRVVLPAVRRAKAELGRRALIDGPVGAETAYRLANSGSYDGVVAMYHDQATIPMKLVAFGTAVNVTLGLSIVRTSVDHGTAYDIAWQGVADAAGMRHAVKLAGRLSEARF